MRINESLEVIVELAYEGKYMMLITLDMALPARRQGIEIVLVDVLVLVLDTERLKSFED